MLHKLIVRPRARPHVAISSGFARLSRRDRRRRGGLGFCWICTTMPGSARHVRELTAWREKEREKERSKEPREFRGILNPWTALQFDTISWPLSVTSMGNRRPRDITVELTPAFIGDPFFLTLPIRHRVRFIHDGIFICNLPTHKNTATYRDVWKCRRSSGRIFRVRKCDF